jgi:hypothetical protein
VVEYFQVFSRHACKSSKGSSASVDGACAGSRTEVWCVVAVM